MEDDGCKPVQHLHLVKSQAQRLISCVIVFLTQCVGDFFFSVLLKSTLVMSGQGRGVTT